MADKQHHYRAFLLRLWKEHGEGMWVWRVSLEDPHSRERKGFPDLERLYIYLKAQTEEDTTEET